MKDFLTAKEANASTYANQRNLVLKEINYQMSVGKFKANVNFAVSSDLRKELEDKGYRVGIGTYCQDSCISWLNPNEPKAFNQ